MSYAQSGTISAFDFNILAGGNQATGSGTLNAVWATGGSTGGYGQPALAQTSVGATVAATSQWATLVANTASAATHQGTTITSVATPAAGGTITYLSAIPTNLTTIYTNRLNAASQGSTTSNTVTYGSTWSNAITFTHTVSFASGDAARYFFNAGGQLKVTCSHPTGTGINLLLNNLASNVGTVVMSAPSSGAVTISGVSYNGVTKIGGGGNAPTMVSSMGYYALSTLPLTMFQQTASTGPSGYLSTLIKINGYSNGPQGINSDNGSIVTIQTIWDEVPNGLVASIGSATTVTAQAPETTNIANTWGVISVSGSVAGA